MPSPTCCAQALAKYTEAFEASSRLCASDDASGGLRGALQRRLGHCHLAKGDLGLAIEELQQALATKAGVGSESGSEGPPGEKRAVVVV